MQTQVNGMPWKSISRSLPMVYLMSKQIIWSTGIILAWTPATYICPEWMWKAPLMSTHVSAPHHPGNSCYHLLWWTICWCYHRWWFRMCCLINELDIGTRSLHESEEQSPADWEWLQISVMYFFYAKISQCSHSYWFHQPIISLIIAESCEWSKNLVGGNLETVIGCVIQLRAYIAISQALPLYGTGLLPTRQQ